MTTIEDLLALSAHKYSQKLDAHKARQVIILRKSGVPLRVIADHFGISEFAARQTGKKTWREVYREYEAMGHTPFAAKYLDQATIDALAPILTARAKRIERPLKTAKAFAGRWILREHRRKPIFVAWLTDTPSGSGGHTAHNEYGWYWSVGDLDNEDPDARLVWDGHYNTSEEAHTAAVDFLTHAPFGGDHEVWSHHPIPM